MLLIFSSLQLSYLSGKAFSQRHSPHIHPFPPMFADVFLRLQPVDSPPLPQKSSRIPVPDIRATTPAAKISKSENAGF